ncbi:MAG: VCBS repeat-containing protein, partial [Caldilineaceae bacterium]|nr:VCBS repeat-containing protein [Caldilineaceae bacterium]
MASNTVTNQVIWPDLRLAKSVTPAGPVAPWTVLTYTLTYTNASGETVRGVSLLDDLPAGVRYRSGGTLVGDAVIWLLGDLPAGASNSVNLSVEVEDGVASVSNVASIDSAQQGLTDSNIVDTTVLEPVLEVIKSVVPTGSVPAGDEFVYSLHYVNSGSIPATGVVFLDHLSSYLIHQNGGDYLAASHTVSLPLGTVDVDETGIVSFTVQVSDTVATGTVITNSALILSDQLYPSTFVSVEPVAVTGDQDFGPVGGQSGLSYLAQSFIATAPRLEDASILIYGAASDYPNMRVQLWGDDSGNPDSSNIVHSGQTISSVSLTPDGARIGLDPLRAIPLLVGARYWIVMDGAYDVSASGSAGGRFATGDPYSLGGWVFSADGGSSWTPAPIDTDLDLKVKYMRPPRTNQVQTTVNQFSEISTTLPQISGSARWGDYDNDGDLDILLVGGMGSYNYAAKVYRNDGGGAFIDIGANLTGVDPSSVAWGDYDNDGDLDILLTGYYYVSSGGHHYYVAKVYRNDGGESFTDINAALIGVDAGSVAWGDCDNDGDLDILLTGYTGSASISKVYRNDGGGTFTDIGAALPGVRYSSVAWGDYDNDGDLDILLTGNASSFVASVYRNEGEGVFTNINAALTGVWWGSVAWGDYDNDGDLDILLTGCTRYNYGCTGYTAKVYRNEGEGIFTDIQAVLTPIKAGKAAWGDFDNDGDLDIALNGIIGTALITRFYRNDHGSFVAIDSVLTTLVNGSMAWGDFDNDSDLDILLTGRDADNIHRTLIYRNNTTRQNSNPASPNNLTAFPDETSVTLVWDPATDAQTPAPGLTYNLRVGTSPGGSVIVSPLASPNGYRQVPGLGNVNQNTSLMLRNLPPGTYYWSVQSIDSSFAGSQFAQEESFALPSTVSPASVQVAGTITTPVALPVTFIVSVDPANITQPVTYTWQATGQTPITHTGGLSDTISYTWHVSGTKTITVTASNVAGSATGTHTLMVMPDTDEPNDSCTDAVPIDPDLPFQSYISLPGDVDVYRIDVPIPYTTIDVTLTHSTEDYDVDIYYGCADGTGQIRHVGQIRNVGIEAISYNVAGETGFF